MKIENSVFQFHPNSPFEKLQLNSLQQQYLADLRAQSTIFEMVQRYLQMGWLVDFRTLYQLIEMLVVNHWVLNSEITDYFSKLQISNQKIFKAVTAPEKSDSVYSGEVLKELPFFRSLNPQLSTFLISKSKIYRYPAEALVCKTGDSSRDLFVLLKGEAAVYKQQSEFRRFISILGEKSVFGEAGFFLGQSRTADIVTLKASEILIVPYQADVLDQYLKKEKAQDVLKRFWVQHALFHSETFKSFPTDCLDALTFSGQMVHLEDQQLLFKQGDPSHTAYIVIQGSLIVQQEGKTITHLNQGAFFGEISMMLNDGTRTASVYGQKNTILLEINRNEFYSLLSQNLYLAQEIQALAQKRLQADVQRAPKT